MKKCPEKNDLFRFKDGELDAPVRTSIEEHLKTCKSCEADMAFVDACEKELRKHAENVFSGISIKNRAMKEIRSTKQLAPAEESRKKTSWLWILAPGIAIIMFAALATSNKKPVHKVFSVSCHASALDCQFGNQVAEMGRTIDLESLVAPMKLSGKFVFTVVASTTSTFEHSGKSEIFPISKSKLTFCSTEATFKLLNGNPVEIIVNGVARLVGKEPVQIHPQSGQALDLFKVVGSSTKAVIATHSQIDLPAPATETSKLKIEPEVAPVSVTILSTDSSVITDVQSSSGAEITQPVTGSVNPFLDNPLELNGN